MLLPLFWFDESLKIVGGILSVTKLSERCRLFYLIFRKLMMVVIVASAAFGIYLQHITRATVTPVEKSEAMAEEIVNDIKVETLSSRID